MKERILNGWNLQRAIYVALGGYMIVQSIMEKQWIGALLGVYFASMGIFAFGCAAGNCYAGRPDYKPKQKSQNEIAPPEFEEININ
ncbi:MAG: hypothetical protein ACHQET_10550 [Chitinophagales bacterium]